MWVLSYVQFWGFRCTAAAFKIPCCSSSGVNILSKTAVFSWEDDIWWRYAGFPVELVLDTGSQNPVLNLKQIEIANKTLAISATLA